MDGNSPHLCSSKLSFQFLCSTVQVWDSEQKVSSLFYLFMFQSLGDRNNFRELKPYPWHSALWVSSVDRAWLHFFKTPIMTKWQLKIHVRWFICFEDRKLILKINPLVLDMNSQSPLQIYEREMGCLTVIVVSFLWCASQDHEAFVLG